MPAVVTASRVRLRRAKPLLGTLVDIQVEADDIESAGRALTAAFAELAAVHRRMSFHEAASDLGRLNRAAQGAKVEVDRRTAEVLRHAADFTIESAGVFDASAAGVLVALGLLPAVAACDEDASTSRDDRCIVTRGAQLLDLGGIAKGYAVDRAIDVLERHGVTSALVNAGGDLRHLGELPVTIQLRDPADPSRIAASVALCNAALASSASSGLDHSSVSRPSALIDMRRREPLPAGAGVSIVAPTCLLADVLTKVVLVSGDPVHPMLHHHGGRVVLHRWPGRAPA